jgi:hypothetical protein
MVTRDTPVRTVLVEHPAAADWFQQRGVICLRCNEVFPGTVGELLATKRYRENQIEEIIEWLNGYLEENG